MLDRAVNAYLQPFYARSKGEALRSFSDTVNQKDHQFFRHAADYSLYYLGQFDDANAGFQVLQEPQRVVTALEVIVDDVFPPEKKVG